MLFVKRKNPADGFAGFRPPEPQEAELFAAAAEAEISGAGLYAAAFVCVFAFVSAAACIFVPLPESLCLSAVFSLYAAGDALPGLVKAHALRRYTGNPAGSGVLCLRASAAERKIRTHRHGAHRGSHAEYLYVTECGQTGGRGFADTEIHGFGPGKTDFLIFRARNAYVYTAAPEDTGTPEDALRRYREAAAAEDAAAERSAADRYAAFLAR